jgi:hypothetical protein
VKYRSNMPASNPVPINTSSLGSSRGASGTRVMCSSNSMAAPQRIPPHHRRCAPNHLHDIKISMSRTCSSSRRGRGYHPNGTVRGRHAQSTRLHLRFTEGGAAYGKDAYVVADLSEGRMYHWSTPDGASRRDSCGPPLSGLFCWIHWGLTSSGFRHFSMWLSP